MKGRTATATSTFAIWTSTRNNGRFQSDEAPASAASIRASLSILYRKVTRARSGLPAFAEEDYS
jgi:hypothetical protein